MENELQSRLAHYWYDEPDAVERRFYGVFEGGGAKGVAYAGALLAMRQKKCWFRAVAGASAGAITAALIASGLTPEEVAQETESALKQLQRGFWRGLCSLTSDSGYYCSEKLGEWLNQILKKQLQRSLANIPEGEVTFGQLYAATGIELNVVAADLSLKCQVIFSHLETPNCSVVDAVVASSSIPFAFASQLLEVPVKGSKESYYHTIVDGGVWSNFPMFVFEDVAFREYYGRSPKQIKPEEVVGFLLQDQQKERPPCGDNIGFAKNLPAKFEAREWVVPSRSEVDSPIHWAMRICEWLLFPFALLGRVLNWNAGAAGGGRGRWPTPRSRLNRYLVDSLDGLLGGIRPPFFGVVACAVVIVGAVSFINNIGTGQWQTLKETDWSNPENYFLRPLVFLLAFLGVATAILMMFATLLGVTANYVLLRASRNLLYGLITTYVAGPGGPVWIERKSNIITLPIPMGITTLSFAMQPEQRTQLIQSAQKATLNKLEEVLSLRLATPGLALGS